MKIIWLKPSEENMENIYEMLKEKNERAAIDIYNEILDEVEILEYFPKVAAKEPLLKNFSRTYRSLIVRNNYKVVYFIEKGVVYIAGVFDCRQNPAKLISTIQKSY